MLINDKAGINKMAGNERIEKPRINLIIRGF
jgi:hypothetical protein